LTILGDEMLKFIRKWLALPFRVQARKNHEFAEWSFTYYPPGSIGDAKGKLHLAFSELWASIADAILNEDKLA